MKLQLHAHGMRVRIDERELALLLDGQGIQLVVAGDRLALLDFELVLADALWLSTEPCWRLALPRADIEAHARTLPCRDSLDFPLDGALVLQFEVDIRDSTRIRGAGRRKG